MVHSISRSDQCQKIPSEQFNIKNAENSSNLIQQKPSKLALQRLLKDRRASTQKNSSLKEKNIQSFVKKLKSICKNKKLKFTQSKGQITIDGKTTIKFTKVGDETYLVLSYLRKDQDEAFDILDNVLKDSQKEKGEDGAEFIKYENEKIILPQREAITIENDLTTLNSDLNYSVPPEQEINNIQKLISKKNDDNVVATKTQAIELTALTAINEDTFSTPLEDREQRINFLERLKNIVDCETQLESKLLLTQGIDNKIKDLNNFSYSKEAFKHVVNLYKNAINIDPNEGHTDGINQQSNINNQQSNTAIQQLDDLLTKYDKESRDRFIELSKQAKKIYKSAINSNKIARKKIVKALNYCSETWKTYENNFTYKSNDGTKISQIVSTITPACEMNIFNYFSDGIRGISSNDRKSEHLLNAWETELKNGEKVLFSGMRHGCTSKKESRTKEMIQMAIYQQLKEQQKQQTPGEQQAQGEQQTQQTKDSILNNLLDNEVIELNLSSTQLLTHTNIAGDKDIGLNQIEELKKYSTQQNPNGEPPGTIEFTLDLPNNQTKKVKLKLNLLTFNFGVNLQTRWHLGRSKEEDAINLENLQKLLGKDFFEEKNNTTIPSGILKNTLDAIDTEINNQSRNQSKKAELEKEKKILLELATQIKQLWRSGKYRAADKNPYAMPARIALLTYKLGYVSSFNCKSGKDRTGVLDAEIKNLAAYIEVNGKVPDYTKEPTQVDKENLSNMHSNCGSKEVLIACTGVMGSKIPFMPNFYGRFSDEYKKEFLGITNDFGI